MSAQVRGLLGELRDQVQAALAHSEAGQVARVARAWHQIASLFGYRLRPELDTSFETLATLLSATIHGLVITALSTPELATHLTVASPFNAAGKQPWSLPAISMASIAMALLEPDPAAEWNEQRLAEIHRTLNAWGSPHP